MYSLLIGLTKEQYETVKIAAKQNIHRSKYIINRRKDGAIDIYCREILNYWNDEQSEEIYRFILQYKFIGPNGELPIKNSIAYEGLRYLLNEKG